MYNEGYFDALHWRRGFLAESSPNFILRSGPQRVVISSVFPSITARWPNVRGKVLVHRFSPGLPAVCRRERVRWASSPGLIRHRSSTVSRCSRWIRTGKRRAGSCPSWTFGRSWSRVDRGTGRPPPRRATPPRRPLRSNGSEASARPLGSDDAQVARKQQRATPRSGSLDGVNGCLDSSRAG